MKYIYEIVDCTDEEWKEYNELLHYDSDSASHPSETPESMLYLIKIGVWDWDTDRVEFRAKHL